MVSGVESSLVIRTSSAIQVAGLFPQNDEDDTQTTIGRTGASTATGLTGASGLTPFGQGAGNSDSDDASRSVTGLNGLLAPPSITAVQEDRGDSEEPDSADDDSSGDAAAINGAPVEGAGSEDEVGPDGLTEGEREQVAELKQRDAEVRRHEQAHKAVGGQYAGAISYTYDSGPDGRRYAVGGEVPIDTSPIAGDPEATIQKLQQVRSAALAPTSPSAADQAIAARASQGIQQASVEKAQQSAEELEALTGGGDEGTSDAENAPTGEPGAEIVSGSGQDRGAGISGATENDPGNGEVANGRPSNSVAGPDRDAGAFSVTGTGGDNDPTNSAGGSGGGSFGGSGQSPFDLVPVLSGRSTLDISI